MAEINGVYTALVTPFNYDYSVNYSELCSLIEYQFSGGINQFVVCGSTGEGTLLNINERRELITKSVEIVRKRGVVGVGCSAGSTNEAISLVMIAQECGANFALVAPPYYVKPTQEGIVKFYEEISAKTNLAIVAYNIPGRVSVTMNYDTLLKISKIPNVIGLKDATLNFENISRLSIDCKEKFNILSGDDLTFPASLIYGTCGTISAISNYCPKFINELYKSWQNNQINTRLVQQIVEINRASSVASNPIVMKYLLSKKGLIKNVLRHPLLPLNDEQTKIVDSIVENLEL